MTRKEWQAKLSQQFGQLESKFQKFSTARKAVFIPSYAATLPKLLDLFLDTNLRITDMPLTVDDETREDIGGAPEELFVVADEEHRIAVEIRIILDNAAIKQSLAIFETKLLDEKYDRLIILALKFDQRVAWDQFGTPFFNPLDDLWGVQTLFEYAMSLQNLDKVQRVSEYLDVLLAVSFDRPKCFLPPVPAYTDVFVGREEELHELRGKLIDKKPIFITGDGGIGKTEVALCMAALYSPPKGAYFIYYDGFADEEQEVIRRVILDAKFDNYQFSEPDNDARDREYAQRLEILRTQYRDALLIIDNFDLSTKPIQEVCQESSYRDLVETGVSLVFTTRYIDCDPLQEYLVIPCLPTKTLLKLMRKIYPTPKVADSELEGLIDDVQRHTHSVVLMAHTMLNSWGRIRPEHFHKAIKNNTIDRIQYPTVPAERSGIFYQEDIYTRTRNIFDVSNLTEMDCRILLYAALLPENGINADLFRNAVSECTKYHLDSIVNRSWLHRKGNILTIHPVIRAVCWGELKPSDENCTDFLNEMWLQYKHDQYDRSQFTQLAELFSVAARDLEDRKGIWHLRAGLFWSRLGKFKKALEYYQETVRRQECSKTNEVDLVRTYNKIGSAYLALGQPEDADRSFKQALKIAKKTPDGNPLVRATTYNNLGITQRALGNPHTALEHRLKAFKIQQALLPTNHLVLAASFNNVGRAYSDLGDYRKALEYSLKALEIRKMSTSSEEDLDLATSYNSIGGIYMRLGDYTKALEYLLKALWIREQVLPSEHPVLATSYNNVGGLYRMLGDHEKSLSYLLKALQLRELVLPLDHSDTAQTYMNIASTYYSMGEYSDALKYVNRATNIAVKALPPDHPDQIAYRNAEKIIRAKLE